MVRGSGTERARNTLAYLRRKITTGEWPVGSQIPIEPELTEMLGVGRSTVREAVRSLASLGMLETLPGRGTFVRSNTPTSAVLAEYLTDFTLEELLSYRRALEIEAAQQAARHRTEDDVLALKKAVSTPLRQEHCPSLGNKEAVKELASRFHYLIFDAAKNRLLASLYAGINERLLAPENEDRLAHPTDAATMQQEHERIADAISRGDFIDAVHAMADHVDNDLVILTPDHEIIPPLQRLPSEQERIEEARAREAQRYAEDSPAG